MLRRDKTEVCEQSPCPVGPSGSRQGTATAETPCPPGFNGTRRAIRSWVRGRATACGVLYLCDELLGATDLAIVLALRAWRPERGPFQPFAWRYVKRDTLRLLAAERRQRDARAKFEAESVLVPHHDTRRDREVYNSIIGALGPSETLEIALGHLVDGRTVRELASRHRCSIRQVRNRVQRVVAGIAEATGAGASDFP